MRWGTGTLMEQGIEGGRRGRLGCGWDVAGNWGVGWAGLVLLCCGIEWMTWVHWMIGREGWMVVQWEGRRRRPMTGVVLVVVGIGVRARCHEWRGYQGVERQGVLGAEAIGYTDWLGAGESQGWQVTVLL